MVDKEFLEDVKNIIYEEINANLNSAEYVRCCERYDILNNLLVSNSIGNDKINKIRDDRNIAWNIRQGYVKLDKVLHNILGEIEDLVSEHKEGEK